MQNRIISIVVGLAVVIAVGALVYQSKKPFVVPADTGTEAVVEGSNETAPKVSPSDDDGDEDEDEGVVVATKTEVQVTPKPQTSGGITMTQVASHSSRTSCWSAVNGSVYDLTSWIPNHPGGEKGILSMCGVDGSAKYNGQHGGQAKQATILAGFKIGVLAN